MSAEDFKKLPIDEKCQHNLWKVRMAGYEEATALFKQLDEKSPEFGQFLGLVRKFVIDTNAVGQEKGLEATLTYIENYALAGKTASEVMSGIVSKCIAAPKAKTRELAIQITMMYIEIGKQDIVMEELTGGIEQKNPKIVVACLQAVATALREFGNKIIMVKNLIPKLCSLFSDRDKSVRDEAKHLVVEIYKWIGPAIRPQLNNIPSVQMAELNAEFQKFESLNIKASPTRYTRAQQKKQVKIAAEQENNKQEEAETTNNNNEEETAVEVDPYELAEPVDVLSRIPENFYEKVESKKWQDRKEIMEAVENILRTLKMKSGDYGDLVRALQKIIQKDNNVLVVALGGRCLAHLATGLKKRFQQYSVMIITDLLEKFKEKKPNVLSAVKDAIDAAFGATTLEAILEFISEALNNKNPQVKLETALFLKRAILKTKKSTGLINKKFIISEITLNLLKNSNGADPALRTASKETLGYLFKLMGEKIMGPMFTDFEPSYSKMYLECKTFSESLTLEGKTVSGAQVPAQKPKVAVEAKASVVTKKKPEKILSTTSANITKTKSFKPPSKVAPKPVVERHLSDEEVDEIISKITPVRIIGEISDSNWKTRLTAVEQMLIELRQLDSKSVPTQAVIKVLTRRPGLKDTNFQVLKAKLHLIKYLAENCKFSTTSAECCLNDISEKFGDTKNATTVTEVMTAIAEATSLAFVSNWTLNIIFSLKSPKVIQDGLMWLSNAIKEFGFSNLNTSLLIDSGKKALASPNVQIRQAAITLFGTMYLYMGKPLNAFFDAEKQSLREQIQMEFSKYEGQKPPAPSKGALKSTNSTTLDDMNDDEPEQEPELVNVQDTLPRVDISTQITDALLEEISDKNWKVRNEGLDKVSAILAEAKFIKPSLGELPHVLAQRLTDSNIKIAQASLIICKNITVAMGPPCKQYVRTLFPGFLQGLGDSKSWMRSASLDAINAFSEQCGYKAFFEGEIIFDAIKGGSPTLRNEVWIWLGEKLPIITPKSIPKEELVICLPHLYSNIEDRNADVRKSAKGAVLGFMVHIGYEGMLKQTEKIKPGSKTTVVSALNDARPNLTVKPLPAKKQAPVEQKVVRNAKPLATANNEVKKDAVCKPFNSKKELEEEMPPSSLLQNNNLKNQRAIDEATLKVLKWNFTTPKREYFDLLKNQMITANVNQTLLDNMFDSDCNNHIKALISLKEDLPENMSALIANLDLICKWLSLRFFDTNPSVLINGLEYLRDVFNLLKEQNYTLQHFEATAIIPYILLKMGDSSDTVKNLVNSLMKKLYLVYPISRIFRLIKEEVKSKNARQRAESLNALTSMIVRFGTTVCYPSAAACFKEVAKQISDHDVTVRNAALNLLVLGHTKGENIFEIIGNIPEKDMQLLKDKIERSRKKEPSPVPENNLKQRRRAMNFDLPLQKHEIENQENIAPLINKLCLK